MPAEIKADMSPILNSLKKIYIQWKQIALIKSLTRVSMHCETIIKVTLYIKNA